MLCHGIWPQRRWLRRALLHCGPYLLLCACQPSPTDTPLQIHITRLATALSTHLQRSSLTEIPALPANVTVIAVPNPVTGEPLDPLALQECALQTAIIKRNSPLGISAKASQRLLLQLEFLQLAPACIATQRQQGNEVLANRLQREWVYHQTNLSRQIFQATLAGTAFRAFWNTHPGPGQYPAINPIRALAALQTLNSMVNRWLQGDYRADSLALELALGDVAGARAGQSLQRLAANHDWLRAANHALQDAVSDSLPCLTGSQVISQPLLADASDYFKRVVLPHSRHTHRQWTPLFEAVTELEKLLASSQTPAYREWRRHLSTLWQSVNQAPINHLQRLTQAQRGCNQAG